MSNMEDGEFYLDLFFDVNRGGFFDVAQRILNYLDYKSFVQFKRSCKMVYKFIRSSNIEQVSGSEKRRKCISGVEFTQCGNLKIFLLFRFYMKSWLQKCVILTVLLDMVLDFDSIDCNCINSHRAKFICGLLSVKMMILNF